MNRRHFLAAASLPSLLPGAARPYHLRYAPRIGWFPDVPVPRQLEMFSEHGFQAFEYNGLPRHSNQEIESFRKKMDSLRMSMGVFVVNSGGWKASALVDKQYHPKFFDDLRRGVEIHQIIGNECATVTSGVAVPNLTMQEQTRNCIEV